MKSVKSVPAAPAGEAGKLHCRWFPALLILLALFGAALRLLTAVEFSQLNGGINNMMRPAVSTDMATYIRLGHQVASGNYSGVFYYQPFYYTVFLPLIYICGGGVWAVVMVQALLGGGTVFLCGLSGKRLFGCGGGVLAAVLCAISTPLLLYAPFHLNETLQAFNLTLWFFLLLTAWEKRRWYWWGASGAVAAIAVLTRGNALLLVFPVVLWLVFQWFRDRCRRREMAEAAAIFLFLLLLIEFPFIWHNTRLLGRLSGPSTASGAVLALGNTPESPPGGRNPGLPAGPMEYPESFHRMMKLQESGVSVPRQMWKWMVASPAAFWELQFRKALLFWDAREIPNNVSLYGEGSCSVVLRWLLPGRSLVLLTLALAGMLLALPRLNRENFGLWILYAFIVIYWLSIALFYNLSRFRAPILPLLAVAAGEVWNYVSASGPTRERILRLIAALLFGIWFCGFSYEFYRNVCEAPIFRVVRPEGTQITSSDGESWIFDHGPLTFGGWRALELKNGMRIGKRFGRPFPGGMLRVKIFAENPGELVLNSGRFQLAAGENDVSFPVVFENGEAGFDVISAPPDSALVIDLQRNYGRTRINGSPVQGEAVIRLRPAL